MSRTNKDKPEKFRFEPWDKEDKPKKKKEVDTVWHWCQATPSWWNNLFHTRPRRKEAQKWEREITKLTKEELEDVEKPNVSNKPHKYYW